MSTPPSYLEKDTAPCIFVPVNGHTNISYPSAYRDLISVDVIHDGTYIPPQYLRDEQGNEFPKEQIAAQFIEERDWGANLVAEHLSKSLGLAGYLTINTARCLLDFGRFPGSTRKGATHLGRFAINTPFSDLLSISQKKQLLTEHYDKISSAMDKALYGKLLKIAVHTYDRYNPSGTERPHVSLVTRMLGYQMESQMPFGVFDPLYPDILAEFTVDRVLRDRVSLTLEKANIPVAHNYPYLLPEGSTEVRHQVWRFFHWLQKRFELQFPEVVNDLAFARIWEMLQDTNLRSSRAGELRSIIHLYRRPQADDEHFYNEVITAYEQVKGFVTHNDRQIIEEYRLSPFRCMSMGIEVRKDLVWDYNQEGIPVRCNPERAIFVAQQIAEAISTYFREDRRATNTSERTPQSLFNDLFIQK